jgi:hypothetical protein
MTTTASHAPRAGSPSILPRLLNLREGAVYLGCSFWTVRDYVLQGLIQVVELPPLRAREGERPRKTLRRVLIDRADLDTFIEARKGQSAPDVQSCAPRIGAEKTDRNRGAVPVLCPQEVARCGR